MRPWLFLDWLIRRLPIAVLFVAILLSWPARAGDAWLPITKEELDLKEYAPYPGVHAVLLYREVFTDDVNSNTIYCTRIKILTEEGRKYADIEIPFFREAFRIHDLKARTIRPDGTAVEFTGEIFEKAIAKARGVKFLAKTFTLPGVQVGTIIEYVYREQWEAFLLPDTHWLLQDELPIRRLVLSRRPQRRLALRVMSIRLPANKEPKYEKDGLIHLELENVPPFQEEEYAPPRGELSMRVDFFYTRELETADKFWKGAGKFWYEFAEKFIGKYDEISREATAATLPDDPPEAKVRKLYARTQQVRNISFERSRTQKEEKRENLKENKSVKDVLKNGYGYGWEINCLFVALARAAGFEASVAYLAPRNRFFFDADFLDFRQLSAYVSVVRVGSQRRFLDPSTRFTPFGLLTWPQTGVRGLLLNKEGGEFVTSPEPTSSQAVVERVARLQLLDDGTLKGKLQVSFTGLEALERRLSVYREDDAGKRKEIEDEIKSWFPAGATLETEKWPDWENADELLRVECNFTLPNFAISTGRRLLVPAGVFQVSGKHPFRSATRVHPIYFGHPFQEVDDVTIELPQGFRVETLPQPRDEEASWAALRTRRMQEGNSIRFQRRVAINQYYIPAEGYSVLRSFYDLVRSADEESVILQRIEPGQGDQRHPLRPGAYRTSGSVPIDTRERAE